MAQPTMGWEGRVPTLADVSLYHFDDPGPLRKPVLVAALDGWVNAGEAGTLAAETLAANGPIVAEFDGDALFDYRMNRPTIDFVKGVMQEVVWPRLTVRLRRLDDRDLLVLSGTEPNWNWRSLGAALAELVTELGVTEQVSMGGIPWAVPHTRPVSLIVTASDAERLAPTDEHPEGLLRVPGAAISALERAVNEAGIPSIGFWARVPQYIGTTYHAAALALLERVASHLQLDIGMEDLAREAADQRVQLDAIAEARPEVKAMVERLAELVDQQGAVSGEQLAAEIERFLRERGGGGDGLAS